MVHFLLATKLVKLQGKHGVCQMCQNLTQMREKETSVAHNVIKTLISYLVHEHDLFLMSDNNEEDDAHTTSHHQTMYFNVLLLGRSLMTEPAYCVCKTLKHFYVISVLSFQERISTIFDFENKSDFLLVKRQFWYFKPGCIYILGFK